MPDDFTSENADLTDLTGRPCRGFRSAYQDEIDRAAAGTPRKLIFADAKTARRARVTISAVILRHETPVTVTQILESVYLVPKEPR